MILWCGGEDIDFPTRVGNVAMSGSFFRSGYSRAMIYFGLSSSYAKSTLFPDGSITSGWLHLQAKIPGSGYGKFCGFGDSATAKSGIFVGTTNAYTKLCVGTYDGSTWTILASEEGNSGVGDTQIDIQLENYGEHANLRVYADSILVIELVDVDVRIAGITGFDSVFLGGQGSTYFSEIIVATTDTRNLSLVTHVPATGDSNDWTGAATEIDEITANDADLTYDNTVGHQALFALNNLPTGSFSVLAVKEIVRACRSSDSTPTTLNLGIKSGSIDVEHNISLSVEAWEQYERYMATNPVTNQAFTMAEINAMQAVLESET